MKEMLILNHMISRYNETLKNLDELDPYSAHGRYLYLLGKAKELKYLIHYMAETIGVEVKGVRAIHETLRI